MDMRRGCRRISGLLGFAMLSLILPAAAQEAPAPALKADLDRLGPEDRMAVVAYDGRELEMLSSWSSSPAALSRTLDTAMSRRSRGLETRLEVTGLTAGRAPRSRALLGAEGRANRLGPEERASLSRLAWQVQRSTTAAASSLRGFASPPGRKVMLLLSGGWPFDPAGYLTMWDGFIERAGPRGEEVFGPLADTANLLGYTIYPVDVPGLDGGPLGAAERNLPVDDVGGGGDREAARLRAPWGGIPGRGDLVVLLRSSWRLYAVERTAESPDPSF